jgi:hypothetical protein
LKMSAFLFLFFVFAKTTKVLHYMLLLSLLLGKEEKGGLISNFSPCHWKKRSIKSTK